MKDLQKGLSISILAHGLILATVLSVWVDKPIYTKTLSLDFSILNFEQSGDRAGILNGHRHTGPEATFKNSANIEKQNAPQIDKGAGTLEPSVHQSYFNRSASDVATGILSDKDGEVEIIGKEGSFMGEVGSGTNVSSASIGLSGVGGGYGGGEGHTIRYGTGSTDEQTFRYIRDGIMKNIRYPEKARRKGLAGRILLSFMVTEGGSINDIKVINSSGRTELDNSAKEAVARTTFSQKIPYKLFVILPIEYRLE